MKNVHSYWAYIVVIILAYAVINAIIGLTQKKEFTQKDFRIGLFTLIAAHIQLLIGLSWYFMSPWYKFLKANGGEVMKDSTARLLAIEHPIMMVVAIILITIGWSKHKKQTSNIAKFKTFAIFYGLALLLVLARIPWSLWLN
ncbi:hypothetical protein ACE1MK_10140 [Tenacibaculum maritimum]|uniref:hypothetical protein n=1 Tax=Tenacibaculum maritimum TaxID=107401 RepID=UPI00132FF346|nr:hypothetical protein [Tenacibaculum maritimum]MCD9581283.1 hypothetical protein [Tenacibaculum maritimum]MCD9634618.1 hypothetical protein [Tenacibaculum maritimum]MDB0600734.1 hypothetical protein [Tenacibaculum maritimum]MDB0612716.1 hypothetical protein [Tenacibaculum maritimum]